MNLFCYFGIGGRKIREMGFQVSGTVTEAKECWWLSIKTKPARICATPQNTVHPHSITFQYRVDNVPYAGILFIPYGHRVPAKNETITIYYDPSDPAKYACHILQ